jgi:hypothetical protein
MKLHEKLSKVMYHTVNAMCHLRYRLNRENKRLALLRTKYSLPDLPSPQILDTNGGASWLKSIWKTEILKSVDDMIASITDECIDVFSVYYAY